MFIDTIPLLSVIIPVYNVAPYIQGTLQSVVAAARRLRESDVARSLPSAQVEVICVDDGSGDGSGAILDAWAESARSEDCGIEPKIIHQPNAGVSAARNAALDVAQGEWVMMLDGDDTWADDLLVKLFEEIVAHSDCDAVGFGIVKVDDQGEKVGAVGANDVPPAIMTGDEVLLDGRGPYSKFIWSSCDKIYRRSVIERNHLRYAVGVRLSEDSLFSQVFLAYAGRIVLRPDVVGYRYLMRHGSAVHTRETKLPDDPFFAFETLYGHWEKLRSPGLCKRLYHIAVGCPSLGKGDEYEKGVRPQAIEFLLNSSVFIRKILPFSFRYGGMKARVFALAYLMSPTCLRRKLLERL